MADVDSNYWGINGKINRTITSSNMTVSVTDYDGNNFSSLNPLVVKIGDTPRLLTGALSVTVNAGTNFFNLGATEFKTTRQDLFVYLGWRAASSTIFILLSRIPYGRVYADFSASQTNEKYGAFSGSTPASTDVVVNIGRVNAQNSGSPSYNWSLPPVDIIINRPIFETEMLSWAPVHTGFSTPPVVTASYYFHGKEMFLFYHSTVAGISNTTGFTITLPFTPGKSIDGIPVLGVNNGVGNMSMLLLTTANNIMIACYGITQTAASWTNSGAKYLYYAGVVPIAP